MLTGAPNPGTIVATMQSTLGTLSDYRFTTNSPDGNPGRESGDTGLESRVPANLPRRFRISEELGKGAMGVVFRVHDDELGTEVALKTFRWMAPEEVYFLKREFRALADIKHLNLVDLHELF